MAPPPFPETDQMLVPTVARPVPGCGTGLFAAAPIEPGVAIMRFGGQVVPAAEFELLPLDRQHHSVQIDEDTYLLSGEQVTLGDYVNHSCDPSGVLVDGATLVARRRIDVGEQITYDYATTDTSPYDEFECHCRSEACRGKVTAEDWTDPELQERYQGYFAPYIQRLIDASRG